ncbi:MAG TPA: hypothetical protein VF399_12860 [bacterium]
MKVQKNALTAKKGQNRYAFLRLNMGIKCGTDMAQAVLMHRKSAEKMQKVSKLSATTVAQQDRAAVS